MSQQMCLNDIAKLFGATAAEVEFLCGDLLEIMELGFRPISGKERDELILSILRRIDGTDLPVSGEQRQGEWEQGWGENLRAFIESGYDVEKLVPRYFKKGVPVRLFGDYVMPDDPDFVLNCTRLFRAWLFRKHLSSFDTIYEFGCGPATHLAFLADEFPGKKLVGLDWAAPSQEIISLLAEHHGWNIHGRHFDFFNPDPDLHLDSNSAVYTFGALEQTGRNYGGFLEFLLQDKPALCINVECLAEFYSPDTLTDYLALKYHKRKNYLDGYLTCLRELERSGRVEILESHHQQFGNMFDDSHSYIIWKPL